MSDRHYEDHEPLSPDGPPNMASTRPTSLTGHDVPDAASYHAPDAFAMPSIMHAGSSTNTPEMGRTPTEGQSYSLPPTELGKVPRPPPLAPTEAPTSRTNYPRREPLTILTPDHKKEAEHVPKAQEDVSGDATADPQRLRDLALGLLLQTDGPVPGSSLPGSPWPLAGSARRGPGAVNAVSPWLSARGVDRTNAASPWLSARGFETALAGSPWLSARGAAGMAGVVPIDSPSAPFEANTARMDSAGSPLMADWDAFDVPMDEPKSGKHGAGDNAAPMGVRHIIRQTVGRSGKPGFEQNMINVRLNDTVRFYWYDPSSRIFETNSSYNHPLPNGRHSTLGTTNGATTTEDSSSSAYSPPTDPNRTTHNNNNNEAFFSRSQRGSDHTSTTSDGAAQLDGDGERNPEPSSTLVYRSQCAFQVHFTEPGTYYFICSLNSHHMRVRVLVEDHTVSNARHIVTGGLLILLCVCVIVAVVLALAFWLRKKDLFLSREDANSEDEYIAIHKLQNIITIYLFPWLATGVMIFVVLILVSVIFAIYRCCRPKDPRRQGQSRGYPKKALTISIWICVAFCLVIAVLLFVAFGMQLNVTNGFNLFAQQLGTSLQYTVQNYSHTLDQVNWLVNQSETLFPDVDIPRDSIANITNDVLNILNKSSDWVVLGQDVIQGAFRLLPILLFLTLQLGLYVSAMSIGDVALRYRRTAVAVLWLVVCCVAVTACACGVVWGESKLLGLIYESATVIGTSPETATEQFGIAPDSFIAQLFSYCAITPTDVSDIVTYVQELVSDINSTMTCDAQSSFAVVADFIEELTPLALDAVVNFTYYIDANIDSMKYILANNPAGVDAFFNKNITGFLNVAADVLSTAYSLVDCNILKDLIGDSIPILRKNVEHNNTVLFVILLIVFGLTILQMVANGFFLFFLMNPQKRWYEARTGRWFRFRYSYVTHRRLLLAEAKDQEITELRSEWRLAWRRRTKPIMYHLLNTRLVMYASSALMFFDCILLVLFNNLARTIADAPLITAMSYLGCVQLILILGASLFRQQWLQVGLLICAFLVVVAVLALSVVQLLLGYIHFGDCLHNARYKHLITQLAKGDSIQGVPQYEACPITYVGHELEVAVYASIMFLNCISLMVTLILVMAHYRFLAPLFQRRPYRGVLLPLASCCACTRRVFKDNLNVRRIYVSVLIFVLVVFLVLFAVLNGSKTFRLVQTLQVMPSPADILQTLDPTVACNGDAGFCSLRVNEMIWACTHNAHSNMEDHFLAGNHYFNISRQLDSGIRSFMIDLWYDKVNPNISDEQDVYVCHSICAAGRRPFRTIAAAYADFLDRYPGQVIMVILQQMVNDTDIARIMDDVGLTKYVWYSDGAPNKDPDYVWPTLQEMIDSGQRVMMFNDAKGNSDMSIDRPEWMYYAYNFQYENDYQTDNITQWRCLVGRGWCNDDIDLYAEDNANRKEAPPPNYCPPDQTTTTTVAPTPIYTAEQQANAIRDFTNCSDDPGPWVNGSDYYNAVLGRQPPLVGRKLSTLNHMISTGVGTPMESTYANVPASIRYNTYRCSTTWNQIINILAYDYWNIDYPLAVINEMNKNITKYGPTYNFQDQWKLLLFGDADIVLEPAPGEIPM